MTQQEQKREEIRLLNLRVDELKQQNIHYGEETGILQEMKSDFDKKIEIVKAEYVKLSESKELLEKTVDEIEKKILRLKEEEAKLSLKVSEEDAQLTLIRSGNIREERRAEELKLEVTVLENRLDVAQKDINVKYASLKGFEEQLLIREGLLNKREETLDLKEKGVKINE